MLEKLQGKLRDATLKPLESEHLFETIFRGLVAAMSPPRARREHVGAHEQDSSQGREPSQIEIRELLLKLLPWLNLAIISLQPSLERLKCLISEFGKPMKDAASSKQWLDIKALLDGAQIISPYSKKRARWTEEEQTEVLEYLKTEAQDRKPGVWLWRQAAKRFNRSAKSLEKFYCSKTNPKYTPDKPLNLKHPRGLITEMARKAMKSLGGEATCPELISFIREDHAFWAQYGHRLHQEMIKRNGSYHSSPVWQQSVSTNAGKIFEPTNRRRGGVMIYKLKEVSKREKSEHGEIQCRF